MKSKSYLLTLLFLFVFLAAAIAQNKTENVILITLDGPRLQEIFGGLDLSILKAKTTRGKVEDTELYKKYWAATPDNLMQSFVA